jgi:phosphinothricin acetyltransferase
MVLSEGLPMNPVRVATAADAETVARIYGHYVAHTAISFEEEPPSADEMAARIATNLKTHPFLVYDPGGGVTGYAYASPHVTRAAYRWSCNVSAYVTPGHARRGLGRALYGELLDLVRAMGFHSAFAGVALPNEASVGLHEAMGFQHLGTYREVGFKHGRWHDVGWWRLGLAEGPPAAEPIPFPALVPAGSDSA